MRLSYIDSLFFLRVKILKSIDFSTKICYKYSTRFLSTIFSENSRKQDKTVPEKYHFCKVIFLLYANLLRKKRAAYASSLIFAFIEFSTHSGTRPQTALFSEVSLQQTFKSSTVSCFVLAHFVNCRTVGHGENVGISKDMGV